jgi:Spy/CpxP family protein refolding chaperone
MKMFIVLISMMSFSAFASIQEFSFINGVMEQKRKCPGLNATQDQRQQVRDVIRRTKSEVKKHASALKAGKEALKAVMIDTTTTKEEAKSALLEFREIVKPVRKLILKARGEVNFDILSGEQRVALLACKKARFCKKRPKLRVCGGNGILFDF